MASVSVRTARNQTGTVGVGDGSGREQAARCAERVFLPAPSSSMPRQATVRYISLRSSLVNLPLSLYAPLVEHRVVRAL